MQAQERNHAIPAADVFARDPTDKRVLVADGYGVRIAVEHRHLVITDGLGTHRRERRIARVEHGITRLIVIGHHGMVTLEALRWMDRTGISFLHVDRDGQVLTASANSALNDARLRRAQAEASGTGIALDIVRALLDAKLAGHAANLHHLSDAAAAQRVDDCRSDLAIAPDLDTVRHVEAVAAVEYWRAWQGGVELRWARKDLPRVPAHWREFRSRRSPLSRGKSRAAADPINAQLNYLYRLAEAECRLACLVLGLDPGMGLLHEDVKARDSLAADLMEVVRPAIERYVLELAEQRVWRYGDFRERDDGHVRLLPLLTHQFAETLPRWAAVVAPHAEMVAHKIAESSPRNITKPTRLTAAKARASSNRSAAPRRKKVRVDTRRLQQRIAGESGGACKECGARLPRSAGTYCEACYPLQRISAAEKGRASIATRIASREGREQHRQAVTDGISAVRAQRAIAAGFAPDDWKRAILPHLANVPLKDIARVTGTSVQSASRLRRGVRIPHPRHWIALQALARPQSRRESR